MGGKLLVVLWTAVNLLLLTHVSTRWTHGTAWRTHGRSWLAHEWSRLTHLRSCRLIRLRRWCAVDNASAADLSGERMRRLRKTIVRGRRGAVVRRRK